MTHPFKTASVFCILCTMFALYCKILIILLQQKVKAGCRGLRRKTVRNSSLNWPYPVLRELSIWPAVWRCPEPLSQLWSGQSHWPWPRSRQKRAHFELPNLCEPASWTPGTPSPRTHHWRHICLTHTNTCHPVTSVDHLRHQVMFSNIWTHRAKQRSWVEFTSKRPLVRR